MANAKTQRVSFKAVRVFSQPAKVSFRTQDGKAVEFRAHKDVPKIVRVEFDAQKKRKN